MFICDHQLYEIIMTACTPTEEHAWQTRLSHPPVTLDFHDQRQPTLFSTLFPDIKSLGAVFGKPGLSLLLLCLEDSIFLLTRVCRNYCQKNIRSSGNYGWPKVTPVPGHPQQYQCHKEYPKPEV